MPLSWEEAKRLARLHGIADELLASARGSRDEQIVGAVDRQLGAVAQEVHALLVETEPPLAEEFQRVVLANPGGPLPPEVRAASLAGWLSAALATQSLEEKAKQEASVEMPRRRKQTIGFKIRAPVTRAESERLPGSSSG